MVESLQATRTGCGPATWRSLAEIALEGLVRTYDDERCPLPYTRRWDGQRAACSGQSVRYALISLLGLEKASDLVGPQAGLADKLWERVVRLSPQAGLTAGDLGLGLWAQTVYGGKPGEFTAARALEAYQREPEACDSVDRAWLLLGADHALVAQPDESSASRLAEIAKRDLLSLYNPATSLFYRHARAGLMQSVSRRVACFANQIYPVMALAVHARRTDCPQARDLARSVADRLCRAQGPKGQWWWLYDAQGGAVVDGHPVFSVHQHGMAPMALLETGPVVGRSYEEAIARGLEWVGGTNELGFDMVLPEQGMVLRAIHRQGFGRFRRMMRGVLWCCGLQGDGLNGISDSRFEVNPECRPYELGWLLCAAGLAAHESSASGSWPGERLS